MENNFDDHIPETHRTAAWFLIVLFEIGLLILAAYEIFKK